MYKHNSIINESITNYFVVLYEWMSVNGSLNCLLYYWYDNILFEKVRIYNDKWQ